MEITDQKLNKKMKRLLLLLSALLLTIGNCGGPLIMRLYFLHGGKRVWLSSWLETGGWPINFIPLIITYFHSCRKNGPTTNLIVIKPPVFIAATVIGILTGLDDYLYAYGLAWLPVSTSSLIIASQLGFTALFVFLLVRKKFTSYTINAVVLLTVGAGILALHSSGDRPRGESNRKYYLGFFMTIAVATLYGLVLPMVELTYKKAKQAITYTLVLEIQLVMCFFATLVCTVGMLINKDFQDLFSVWKMPRSSTATRLEMARERERGREERKQRRKRKEGEKGGRGLSSWVVCPAAVGRLPRRRSSQQTVASPSPGRLPSPADVAARPPSPRRPRRRSRCRSSASPGRLPSLPSSSN